jgi:hypothetical protein
VVLLLELELADSEDEVLDSEDEVLDFEDDSVFVPIDSSEPGELAEEHWLELEER